MTTKHKILEEFFTERLERFLIPDLVRLRTEIRPRGDQQGCTVATAMLAFATLDLVGYLIRPDEAKKEATTGNITHALSRKAALFPLQYAEAAEAIVKLYRNGVMHQLFPKSCGISKPSPANEQIFFFIDGNTPHLNVDVLVDDLLKALETLKERAESDSELASRMEERILSLQCEDRKCRRENAIAVKEALRVCPKTTTTTA